jgi:hypothetical protein
VNKIPSYGMIILLFFFTGCCSIINTTRQNIDVISSPPGALVTLNGVQKGITPVTLELNRNGNHNISIVMDEYQPYEITTVRNPSLWILGDLLFLLSLPVIIIDTFDGAVYNIEPSIIKAQLLKKDDDIVFLKHDRKEPDEENKFSRNE